MKPRRRSKKTVLIYCEGLHDLTFVKYLVGLFDSLVQKYHPEPKKGDGGSPDSLVRKSAFIPGDFDRRIVLCDADRGKNEIEKAEQLAKKLNVEVIVLRPCLDAVLLDIIDPSVDHTALSSSRCKKQFEAMYLDSKQRTQSDRYDNLITKTMMKSASKKHDSLARLLDLLK